MTITTPPAVSMVEDSTALDVRSALRRLLDSRFTPQELLQFVADDDDVDRELWTTIARDLGLTALLIPEDLGGAGASARESAAVLVELGRSVAPVPYLSSAVIATTALVQCARLGSPSAAGVLPDVADGAIAVLAIPAGRSSHSAANSTVTATSSADGSVVVSGNIAQVLGAAGATSILVPAEHHGAASLVLVTDDAPRVAVSRRTGIDRTRATADLQFDAVGGVIVADGEGARVAVQVALDTGAALLASEQVGICEWSLDAATQYLTVRHQFGRPIGSYQALRHRTAQLWIDINHARAAAIYAASTLADGSADQAVAGSLAQAYCSTTALRVVEETLQMHGGIGFTWDHPLHLYLKRAFADTVLLGDADTHKRALAALIDIPQPAGWSAA
ncbi:MAG: acyl-CoA dehydrogenase [Gordonia sp.]|nr:acyl-CoA dehydrogenase [Gordonia sp. (in: high G+C Gram-positive bacteria)]